MSQACPICSLEDLLDAPGGYECATCGHTWAKAMEEIADEVPAARVVKDAVGNILQDGDTITLVKELKLGGAASLKLGAKAKNIRLIEGDHEIDCKIDGIGYLLKAAFVKKA